MSKPALTPSDAQLLALARSGNSAAYNSLISRYFTMVHTVAFAWIGHHETAEDLAQEVFLRVHQRLGELREGRRFAAWVAHIARNLALDWQRAGRRRSHLATLLPLDAADARTPDPRGREEIERMERREEDRLVREAVLRPGLEAREVVLLRYMEELDVAEIAQRLGVQAIAVRRRLERALATLHGDLEPRLTESVRAWRPSAGAVARTTALVAGVATLSGAGKSAFATALASDAAGAPPSPRPRNPSRRCRERTSSDLCNPYGREQGLAHRGRNSNGNREGFCHSHCRDRSHGCKRVCVSRSHRGALPEGL